MTRYRYDLSLGLLVSMMGSPCHAESIGTVEQRVIGGSAAAESDFPAVGSLIRGDASATRFVCTGTLIASRLVLTAAHCVGETSDLAFALGSDPLLSASRLPVVRARMHPDFAISREQVEHDIAVVELGGTALGVVPVAPSDSAPRPGDPVTLVGFGATHVDEATSQPDSARLKNAAASSISEVSGDALVIGRGGQPENCTGDSGGPALLTGADGSFRVGGVVSSALFADTPCVGGSVHARVDTHLDFIEATRVSYGEYAVDERAGDPGNCSVSSGGRRSPMGSLAPCLVGLGAILLLRRSARCGRSMATDAGRHL